MNAWHETDLVLEDDDDLLVWSKEHNYAEQPCLNFTHSYFSLPTLESLFAQHAEELPWYATLYFEIMLEQRYSTNFFFHLKYKVQQHFLLSY